MRGTLLAVVAVAVIAGLGVVALARQTGWLNPAAAPTQPPPPTVVVAPPPPPPVPVVVTLRQHLYAGDAVDKDALTVRELRADEVKDYEANKADYIVSPGGAAYFRTLSRDVMADTPLKKAYLDEPKKPEPLASRLAPGTRAVDLALTKDLAASGMIAVGDWVDVYILTDVSRSDSPTRIPQGGVLVQSAPVVAKRGTLYPYYTGLPDGPIGHTLAVNPYRAALLDYAKSVGTVSIVPVSASEKKRLDELKVRANEVPAKASLAIPFAEPGSPEYTAEQDRIEKYNRGEIAVGRADLARVLRLTPLAPPPPPATRTPPVQIELFSGVQRSGTASFPTSDPTPPYVPPPAPEYLFTAPAAPTTPVRPAPKN